MHAANVSKSDRLKRVLRLLKRGGAYSTRDIIRQAHVCSVSAIISELRQQRYRIGCQIRDAGRGRRVWMYMLEGRTR